MTGSTILARRKYGGAAGKLSLGRRGNLSRNLLTMRKVAELIRAENLQADRLK